MAEEKRKFVLYEYLLYFWKRKWFFVIIPLITTILIASAVYVMKNDKKYTGVAEVYTGSTPSRELKDPDIIPVKIKNVKDLEKPFVSEKGIVKFTVNGDSKKVVTTELHQIILQYKYLLDKDAQTRLTLSKKYEKALNERVKALNEVLAVYDSKEVNLTTDLNEEFTKMIKEDRASLKESAERAYKLKSDHDLYEKPEVLYEKVDPKKTYLPESIAIGIILGLVLTVALLMLLKYLGDARRYYKHD